MFRCFQKNGQLNFIFMFLKEKKIEATQILMYPDPSPDLSNISFVHNLCCSDFMDRAL